jgi:hypothetical protein
MYPFDNVSCWKSAQLWICMPNFTFTVSLTLMTAWACAMAGTRSTATVARAIVARVRFVRVAILPTSVFLLDLEMISASRSRSILQAMAPLMKPDSIAGILVLVAAGFK